MTQVEAQVENDAAAQTEAAVENDRLAQDWASYGGRVLDSVTPMYEQLLELGKWAPHVNWGARLRAEGHIKSPAVSLAFADVQRFHFLNGPSRYSNALDRPLPIGHGQTNSQPSLVAQTLEWLNVQSGDRVLDVGSGSAWTTVMLGKLVGEHGRVFGIERIPELVEFGRRNIARYEGVPAEIRQAEDGVLGLPSEAPFDRILVSARMPISLAKLLRRQLAPKGVLLAPATSNAEHEEDNPSCQMLRAVRTGSRHYREDIVARDLGFVPYILSSNQPAVEEPENK